MINKHVIKNSTKPLIYSHIFLMNIYSYLDIFVKIKTLFFMSGNDYSHKKTDRIQNAISGGRPLFRSGRRSIAI